MKTVLAAALVALVSINVFANDEEKIIGRNDLVAVNADVTNVPYKYRKLADAFGIISMGCTATHIGNGYVLTAGHCFEAGEELQRDQDCAGISIRWGVREGKESYLTSNCENIIAMQQSDSNDFAVLKVTEVPPVSVNVELNRRARARDQITIFSHPEELPLRWSKTCVVESRLDATLPKTMIQHKCDTNPGSSGATILDARTSKVVGIHDGGHITSGTRGMNYGTYLHNFAGILKELGFK